MQTPLPPSISQPTHRRITIAFASQSSVLDCSPSGSLPGSSKMFSMRAEPGAQAVAKRAARFSAFALSVGSSTTLPFLGPSPRAASPRSPPPRWPPLRRPPLRSRLCLLFGLPPAPSISLRRPRLRERSGSAESRLDAISFSSRPKRFARSARALASSSSSIPKRLARSARRFASSSAAVDARPIAYETAGSAGFSSAVLPASAPDAAAAGFSVAG